MMHRTLTTAGIEVAPHYHQLLVLDYEYSMGNNITATAVRGGLEFYPRVY